MVTIEQMINLAEEYGIGVEKDYANSKEEVDIIIDKLSNIAYINACSVESLKEAINKIKEEDKNA